MENVNARVDALIQAGALRRLLAFTELKFSNSMIEAWWRSLKHQWLFLHPLESVATIRRLVTFYVDLAGCPGQLTIRAGATCPLERGKHTDRRNWTMRV